ncbi:MAG: SDR family oxidoreductase, partial [Anaerolineaceae bacterium]|nr:SDR family oxidoreductase [Anaerolineaceae bacterium]
SSRGLGFATAQLLAREGANVAVNSRSAEKVTQAVQKILSGLDKTTQKNVKVAGLTGDVTLPETPEQLVHQAIEAFGGLDMLVTNAGGPPAGPFESFDDRAWYQAIEASLLSHVRLIRAALPYLRKSSSPSVLTITSYSVKQPIPNLVLSNSIRAATVGLTKTLALELGQEQIRFNSILPAAIDTERIQQLLSTRATTNGTTIEEETRKQAQESPLGRIGTPEEFANAAVFLLSPAASFITGVMLTIDGGMYKGTL